MEKHFTPKEASKTLPYVKRLTEDALASGKKLRGLYDVYGEVVETRDDYKSELEKFDKTMGEFQQLGCDFKDWNFEVGLVDFPSIIDGEEVCLCWKSDEESLQFYHGLNAGFAGRKPIPTTLLN
jgi:hypothetical protein